MSDSPLDALPDDSALFDGALTDETPAEPETTVEASEDQARDDQGRFAKTEPAKTETAEIPETVVEKPTEKPVDNTEKESAVPSWRLREINEEKRAAVAEAQRLRDELAQLRQPSQKAEEPKETKEAKPDPLLDPEGYEQYLERKFEEKQTLRERNLDMRLAHSKHGDLFEKAYGEAQAALAKGDPALKARMNSTQSPGEELIKWYRETQTMREVGNDPTAWLEKKLAERLDDPAFLAKAIEKARGSATQTAPGAKPVTSLPPSLSMTTRAGDSTGSADDNDISDAALFAHATR